MLFLGYKFSSSLKPLSIKEAILSELKKIDKKQNRADFSSLGKSQRVFKPTGPSILTSKTRYAIYRIANG